MAGTTGKRDREKLKQQKRLDKQKRKEERQSAGPRSFDDMIAYVDEYGRLSSTPPEAPAEEVDASAIRVSTPKKEELEALEAEDKEPRKGRVDFFNSTKGFGFIKDEKSGEKYFFHITSAPAHIAEGNNVIFELEDSARGKNAVRIQVTV